MNFRIFEKEPRNINQELDEFCNKAWVLFSTNNWSYTSLNGTQYVPSIKDLKDIILKALEDIVTNYKPKYFDIIDKTIVSGRIKVSEYNKIVIVSIINTKLFIEIPINRIKDMVTMV